MRLALAGLLLLLSTQPLAAWGRDGHRMVCRIAWLESRPATRERIDWLLAEQRWTRSFEDACLWADDVRSDPRLYRFAADSPRHYVNLPSGIQRYDERRDCADRCVVEAVGAYSATLAGRQDPQRTRPEALFFLAHYVGDLHQPLHAGYAGDRGGNDLAVRFLGKSPNCSETASGRQCRPNLHALWDSVMIEFLIDSDEGIADWRDWANTLHRSIDPAQRRDWRKGTVIDWVEESAKITAERIYPFADMGLITASDVAAFRPLIEARIRQAGVRLSALLDAALP